MKILQIAPYTTNTNLPFQTRNITGFGYMTYDIARNLAIHNQVDMLLLNILYDDFRQDGIDFIGISKKRLLCHLLDGVPLKTLIRLYTDFRSDKSTNIRTLFYWLLTGYVKNVVKKGGYDIVHIHGCNFYTELLIVLLESMGQKYVITLHGLNSFSETVGKDGALRRYERYFLHDAIRHNRPITVISSGIKRTIMKFCKVDEAANIHVVYNSFNFPEGSACIDT